MNLIFDLDGTLLYTLEDLKDSVNYALKKFGFPLKSLSEVQKAVGDGLKMLIFRSLPENTDSSIVDAVLAEMKAHYAEHCHDKTTPYVSIVEMLRILKSHGHKICIVSNKADSMVQVLKTVYFDDLVDLAIGESEYNQRKPAPDMVLTAMKRFGRDAIYIGDSEVDIQTAANAGIPCYSVTWGYRSVALLKAHGAKYIFNSPLALTEAILNESA